jgi:hypothetical protein
MDDYKVKPKQPFENVMVKINGKSFHCECGCNVFHHPDEEHGNEIYICNACELEYKGE